MGFIDFFRPKWRHSEVDVRTEAVRNLGPEENATLVRVAREDKDARVRRIAVKRLDDPAVLEGIAASDPDASIRELASDKASDLLIAAAAGGQAAALAHIKSDRDLGEVARRTASEAVRGAAVARIAEDKVLLDLVRRLDGQDAKLLALARIHDGAVLRDVALGEEHKAVALAAVARIVDTAVLEEIARLAKAKAARQAARDKLPATANGEAPRSVPPVARGGGDKTRRALLQQLAIAAEAVAARSDWEQARADLRELEGRFAEVESAHGDEAVEKRFADAVKRFTMRREVDALARQRAAEAAAKKAAAAKAKAVAKPAAEPVAAPVAPEPPPEAAPPAPAARPEPTLADRLLVIAIEAEKLASSSRLVEARVTEITRRWHELDDGSDAALEDVRERFTKSEGMLTARLADEKAMRDARTAEARGKLEKLLTDVERAVAGSNPKSGENALRNAQQALRAPGGEEELRGKLRAAVDRLVLRLGELREAESWKRFASVPKLEELCKEAEALAQVIADVEDKSRAPALLKDLQARWKAVGPAPNEKHEALWTRFKTACDAVYERCKEFFGKLDEERGTNLSKKEELCAQVEALVESSEWKETSEKIKSLQEQWKRIGPVPQDKGDAIWKRFRGACDAFFDRRKVNDTSRDGERAANLELKLLLVTRVEVLATSSSWKESADAIKAAQDEWQEIGPAPRAESDAVWKRFRAACDAFFDRRKVAFAQLDEERRDNLAQKQLLCEKAEALASAEDHDAALEAVKALQAEWKSVGPVPKDHSDEIWRRFRTACDVVYAGPIVDENATAAPTGDGSGVSGFANRLPLEALVARLASSAPATAPGVPSQPPEPVIDARGETLPAIPSAKAAAKNKRKGEAPE